MAYKILVVDDAAFMRMMIKDILVKNGFEVVAEAQDGAQAVEKYKEHSPDLVTMDITMPEKTESRLLKKSRKSIRRQKSSCVRQWASNRWLSTPSRRERKTLSSNRSRLTASWKPSIKR